MTQNHFVCDPGKKALAALLLVISSVISSNNVASVALCTLLAPWMQSFKASRVLQN